MPTARPARAWPVYTAWLSLLALAVLFKVSERMRLAWDVPTSRGSIQGAGVCDGALYWLRASARQQFDSERMIAFEWEIIHCDFPSRWTRRPTPPPSPPPIDPDRFERTGAPWFAEPPKGQWIAEWRKGNNPHARVQFEWQADQVVVDPATGQQITARGSRTIIVPLWMIGAPLFVLAIGLTVRYRHLNRRDLAQVCACGYPRTGLQSACCPECGTAAPTPA